jgi:hypothetical protein
VLSGGKLVHVQEPELCPELIRRHGPGLWVEVPYALFEKGAVFLDKSLARQIAELEPGGRTHAMRLLACGPLWYLGEWLIALLVGNPHYGRPVMLVRREACRAGKVYFYEAEVAEYASRACPWAVPDGGYGGRAEWAGDEGKVRSVGVGWGDGRAMPLVTCPWRGVGFALELTSWDMVEAQPAPDG